MAAAAVATEFGEYGHDLVAEIDRQVDVAIRGRHQNADGRVAVADLDLGDSVGQRQNPARGSDANHSRIGDLIANLAGQVLPAIMEVGDDDELPRVADAL